MGIDAIFYITAKPALNDSELTHLRWLIKERFSSISNGKALEIVTGPHYLEGVEYDEETQVLSLNTCCRHYGKYYERGEILSFIALAEMVELFYSQCRFWYGGDCDVGIYVFDKAERDDIKEHFYRNGFKHNRSGVCPTCGHGANHIGGYKGVVTYHCPLCGDFEVGEESDLAFLLRKR